MMMEVKKGLIGVIMPIYNTEKYLTKSIRSVLRQSYKNFIVVLVNDCSPDNSLEICKKYKSSDSRVYIVDKPKNEGLNRARFSGIEIAQKEGCEFITHLDSDDWLQDDALEQLVDAQRKYNADIVEARCYRCWGPYKKENKGTLHEFADTDSVVISQPELYDNYFISYFGINKLGVNMWGKLYRIGLYEPHIVSACDYKMGEDLYTNMHILPNVKRYCYLNRAIYNYRYGGMTSKYNPHLLSDLKRMFVEKVKFAKELKYPKAFIPSAIEMKNVLFSFIEMRLEAHHSKKWIIADLEDEFNDESWLLFDEISKEYVESNDDPEMQSVFNRDISNILHFIELRRKAPKTKVKRFIKRIMSKF